MTSFRWWSGALVVLIACVSAAADLPQGQTFTNALGMSFTRINAGEFQMGQAMPGTTSIKPNDPRPTEADWDEHPVHRVSISRPMLVATTEVTNAQYEQFDPKHRDLRGREKFSYEDDEPVIFVRYDEAVAFCRWLSEKDGHSYRLPTEAEWEYACRAGTTTPFSFGDALPMNFHKWPERNGLVERYFPTGTLPPEYQPKPGKAALKVAQTPANAWGLFDMHGNVQEWCLDWYGPYDAADQTDPVGRATGDFRITRGGGHSELSRLLRSANRSGRLPETRSAHIGFRVVMADAPLGKLLAAAEPPLNQQRVAQDTTLATPRDATVPFFVGPRPFVKIPPNSVGPMFSRHNHSPAIAECPNGDLLAVWYSCVDEGGSELCVLASRLRRGATEWDEASPFFDGPDVNDHAPKLFFDGDRTLFSFTRGYVENVVRTSTDSGATWSSPRSLQPHGEFANTPIRTKSGALLVPHDNRGTSFAVSKDNGATWSFTPANSKQDDVRAGGTGKRLAGIHNALTELADGTLLALGRIDDAAIQERFNFRTPASTSTDGGLTWSYAASEFPAISSVQRPVILRLREGPLLYCSFTDQWRDYKNKKGMAFTDAAGKTFTGYGMFAALSDDEAKTWATRKLLTPGGPGREFNMIDRGVFSASDTSAEPCGYLAACQSRDGTIHLITSKNHYAFNLAWLKQRPLTQAK